MVGTLGMPATLTENKTVVPTPAGQLALPSRSDTSQAVVLQLFSAPPLMTKSASPCGLASAPPRMRYAARFPKSKSVTKPETRK